MPKKQSMQKVLTQMNIQLANVLSDVSGVTGQAIIQAILAGERDPHKLAELRDPRVRASEEQIARYLEGNWQEDLLFVLKQEQQDYEFCQQQMAECDGQLEQYLQQREDRSRGIIFSGDAVEDKATADAFAAGYGVMHRWRKMADGGQTLLVGADNFSFPVPLKKNGVGQWFFDTAAGKDEILSRRIGRNELAVIDICGAVADAQAEYYSQPHDGGSTRQFAQKFISDVGKQNGLYWEAPEGQPKSPLGPLVAFATAEGYSVKPNSHAPFQGYYFHMLTRQGSHALGSAKDYVGNGKMVGGFALVAYPAEYGNSGVMTFIINQDGVLLQKDLGKTTTETATAMSEFDPDTGWSPVEE